MARPATPPDAEGGTDHELQFLRVVLDNISDIVSACDASGKLILFNQAGRAVYGAPDATLDSGEWTRQYRIVDPATGGPFPTERLPLVRALARPDELHMVKYVAVTATGERVSLVGHSRAIRGPGGDVIGAVNVARDVTASERAAMLTRESEARYRMARDAALDAFMVLDAVRDADGALVDLVYRDVNERGAHMLGKTPADLIGVRFTELFPGMRESIHFQTYVRVLETGVMEEHEFLSPFLAKETWIHRKILRLDDGVIINARDITEARRLRDQQADMQRIEAAEIQFRTLAETIPQIVWTSQPDGHLDYYNQRWFDYTGMTLEETMGWGWAPVIHPDDLTTCIERWTRSFTTDVPYEVEYRFRRASDGAYRWHLGRALPVRDAAGNIIKWFGTCTDIHEQKEARTELELRVVARTSELMAAKEVAERAREDAEAANRAKSDFLSRMSHELRTPLNAIIGFAGVLQRNKRGVLDETSLTHIERIRANGRHLLGLINNVLDLAKVEAGHVELTWSLVSVDALAQDVCATCSDSAHEAGVQLKLLPHALPATPSSLLRADETKLRQVLLNLVGNAIKFTPRGGEITVALQADPVSGYPLQLDVTDSGIGIPLAAQERVFEAFEQADSSTTSRYGGTGLGLSISRALCETMGFRLTLVSAAHMGSTFSVMFDRRAPVRDPRPPLQVPRSQGAHEPSSYGHDLLTELGRPS